MFRSESRSVVVSVDRIEIERKRHVLLHHAAARVGALIVLRLFQVSAHFVKRFGFACVSSSAVSEEQILPQLQSCQ